MASAYKSALRADIAADSDESMSEDFGASSSEAGSGSESESESSEQEEQTKPVVTNGKKAQDSSSPAELRNRILMLTSRGVSFRSVIECLFRRPQYNNILTSVADIDIYSPISTHYFHMHTKTQN